MTALEQAQADMANTTDAISVTSRKMVQAAESANSALTDASRKMRDGTDKLGAAMLKFTGIFGSSDFANQAAAAASLAESLERLAALEERGMLTKVLAALSPKS